MIHILPYLEHNIDSEKPPEAIYAILQSVTTAPKYLLGSLPHSEFFGEVHPTDFKIVSNINYHNSSNLKYKNSFLPIMKGKIKARGSGSVIELKLSLHLLVRVFLTVWFGMMGLFFLIGLLYMITSGGKEFQFAVATAVFILAGQIMVRSGFYIPAKKALKRLEELLG